MRRAAMMLLLAWALPAAAWEAPGGDGFEGCSGSAASVSSWSGVFGTAFPTVPGNGRMVLTQPGSVALQFVAPQGAQGGDFLAVVAEPAQVVMTLSRCAGRQAPMFANCRSGPSANPQLTWSTVDGDACVLEPGASYYLNLQCLGGCTLDLASLAN